MANKVINYHVKVKTAKGIVHHNAADVMRRGDDLIIFQNDEPPHTYTFGGNAAATKMTGYNVSNQRVKYGRKKK